MIDLTNPAILEAVTAMNRKDSPELVDLDEILLAVMRRSCRLDIPLRTKEDFGKLSQVVADLAARLGLISSDHGLTTLQALQAARSDVDRANRPIKTFCPSRKRGDHTSESAVT